LQSADHVEAEGGCDGAVHDAVVERHGDVAHRADRDLAVADDGTLGHAMEAEDRDLGVVHERRHEEAAELPGARDGEGGVAELVRGQRPRPGTVREACHLGVDLVDAEPLARADDGHDEAIVGLHRDADVDAVEEHDLVALEPRVELGVAPERARGGVDCVRDEPAEIDAGEVALLDERHRRHLALSAAHLLDDRPPDASHGDTPSLARLGDRAHVRLDDPPVGAASHDREEVDAELFRELAHGRCRPHGRGGIGWHDRHPRLLARWCALLLAGLDGAQQLLALLADDDDHGADRGDVALGNEDLQHRSGARRGDLDRRLVRLHLDERLILGDGLTLLDEPARDLGLGQPLAEIGELELVRHGGAGYCDVSATARPLIGRDDELRACDRLLDARDELPGTVVLHGQAGIGKTSLWLAGIDGAVARGYRPLSCRTSEAETQLSYAGLADLLGGVVDDVVPELPPIQRRALEAALLLGETEARVDERAVAAAFLAALRLLAGDGLLYLAVDDLQWLDAASLAAVRFALSRLADEPIATLLTVRGEPPPWLRRSVPETRLATVEIGGLSIGALHELLRTRLDTSFPRPTLLRLWETSGGNPFFALELADALRRRGETLAPGEALPIPATLDELLRERLEGLGTFAIEVASVVAAVAEATIDLVEAAVGARYESALAQALDAKILERDGDHLRFTHPLLASAVAARQTPSRRRLLHARLAEIVPTVEERARHLALAAGEPSDDVAALLEEAARSAQARGAPSAAAELAEHALRLTPPGHPGDVRRRLLFASRMHNAGGDTGRATALLEQARADATGGPDRAAVLIELAAVQVLPRDAEALYLQALAEAEGDHALEAEIHLCLAGGMRWGHGVERGITHAELAVNAAALTDDADLTCRALAQYVCWQCRSGRGLPRAEMEEALALERTLPGGPLLDGPSGLLCLELVWALELDTARELLVQLGESLATRNEPESDASVLWKWALLEWRAGNWAEADRCAARTLDLLTQLGRVMPPDEFPAAIVAAHRGRVDEARARAKGAASRAEAEGITIGQSGHGWVLGFVELSLGEPTAALPHLRRSYELRNTFMYEPGMRVELGDLLEALIATGELDEATAILDEWEPRAAAVDRAWALAILARCRGLLLAARGDLDAAFASFEHALAEHARSTDPFHHARTLLALGRTQRRAKKRAAARATLEDALARFELLGAPLWAEQTRAELARIGGRVASPDELTEAERRVAHLVADGRTNRQVAAALFLTEHSVATALTRIYRKLGVRSRTELAKRLRANT
jgi:DNA-binding CsgD family transcriptional regulator